MAYFRYYPGRFREDLSKTTSVKTLDVETPFILVYRYRNVVSTFKVRCFQNYGAANLRLKASSSRVIQRLRIITKAFGFIVSLSTKYVLVDACFVCNKAAVLRDTIKGTCCIITTL